jgi:hypothetical protein
MNKQKLDRCENCYWYRWEDSVWGYCWRFPMQIILEKIFPKIKYKQTRPEVYYNDIACGEFKKKEEKNAN